MALVVGVNQYSAWGASWRGKSTTVVKARNCPRVLSRSADLLVLPPRPTGVDASASGARRYFAVGAPLVAQPAVVALLGDFCGGDRRSFRQVLSAIFAHDRIPIIDIVTGELSCTRATH
jgi:hypothetical protein